MRIIIRILLILALMGTPAYAANLFVPDQHPTIQAAVDAATPGDRILVGPGNFAGARIDKWVKISGEGDATVINEPSFPGSRFHNAFVILSGADKTEISDLKIELSSPPDRMRSGIFVPGNFGPPPTKGVIRNVTFVDLARAVHIRNSSGWIIADNTISEITDPYWDFVAAGIWLNGTGNSLVANNTIESQEDALPHLVIIGINLSAAPVTGHADNNKIVNNTVSVRPNFALKANDIELFQFPLNCEDAVYVLDNKIIANEADFVALTPSCLADHNVVH